MRLRADVSIQRISASVRKANTAPRIAANLMQQMNWNISKTIQFGNVRFVLEVRERSLRRAPHVKFSCLPAHKHLKAAPENPARFAAAARHFIHLMKMRLHTPRNSRSQLPPWPFIAGWIDSNLGQSSGNQY